MLYSLPCPVLSCPVQERGRVQFVGGANDGMERSFREGMKLRETLLFIDQVIKGHVLIGD